jgi:hypothetical protein
MESSDKFKAHYGKTFTRDQAADIVAWFSDDVYKRIVRPWLEAECKMHGDLALQLIQEGANAAVAAAHAAQSTILDKLERILVVARGILDVE